MSEERKVSSERRGKMREELEDMDTRLEEERKRSADLQAQVGTQACLPITSLRPQSSIPNHRPLRP